MKKTEYRRSAQASGKRKRITFFKLFLLFAILIAVFVLSLFLGSSAISPSEAIKGLFSGSGTAAVIMRYIRFPRILAALLAGIGLSVSGVLLQTITDNRLASPGIIGVNSGAGLAVILALSYFPKATHFLPIFAFAGAVAATSIILFSASRIGTSKVSVILSGMAMNAVLNAGISFVSIIDTDVLSSYSYFSVGGVSDVTPEQLLLPAVMIFVSLALSLMLSRKITILSLGDDVASSLGIRVGFMRTICILLACASAASAVSFAGLLGFVGLIIPNASKKICPESTASILVSSALMGGIAVIAADTAGRTVFAPTEVPVGIVMSLIGAPIFFALILGRRKNGR